MRSWLFGSMLIGLAALGATRVANINTAAPAGHVGASYARLGIGTDAGVFMPVAARLTGAELYRLDAANGSWAPVCDVYPGSEDGVGSGVVFALGDTMIFGGYEPSTGSEPWISDGTPAGTRPLMDIWPGSTGGFYPFQDPTSAGSADGRLYFFGNDAGALPVLYVTDGTSNGTAIAAGVNLPFGTRPEFTRLGNRLYFRGVTPATGYELWMIENGQVSLAADVEPGATSSNASNLRAGGSTLFFLADQSGFSNLLFSLQPDGGVISANIGTVQTLTTAHGVAYYGASNVLWRWDGTANPVEQVPFLSPGNSSGFQLYSGADMVEVADTAYFSAFTSNGLYQLWSVEGRDGGAGRVSATLTAGNPTQLTPFQGALYFVGNAASTDLWVTDGGDAQKVSVLAGEGFDNPNDLFVAGGRLYFLANGADAGQEPMAWDGTTLTVFDLSPDVSSSQIRYLTGVGQAACFSATDGVTGRELYCSEAPGSVRQQADLNPFDSSPQYLCAVGDDLVFQAVTPAAGQELALRRPDGGVEVVDLYPGPSSGSPREMTALDDHSAVFTLASPIDVAVARYDLADGGWSTLADLGPPGTPFATGFTRFRGKVYFAARDNVNGAEPWVTDGTDAGTHVLVDLRPGNVSGSTTPASSIPSDFVAGDTELYFYVDGSDDGGTGFFATDGTPQGTHRVFHPPLSTSRFNKAIAPLMGGMLAGMQAADGTEELWLLAADGGVLKLGRLAESQRGDDQYEHALLGDKVVFIGTSVSEGDEPWVTDGTPAGTTPLKDIFPGPSSSAPGDLTQVGASAYFRAGDPLHGPELWKTDGTAAGTVMVDELVPGPAGGAPGPFVQIPGRLVFPAFDAQADQELYERPLESTPPVVTPQISGTLGSGGYYVSDVSVSFSISDPESDFVTFGCAGGAVTTDTGAAEFDCRANSEGGTTEQNVVVKRDATPPAVSCPADIATEAEGPSGANVQFSVNATDVLSGVVDVSPSVPPGGFPVGTTSVVATAHDVAGNTGQCTFVVTVSDTTPPALRCPSKLSVNATAYEGEHVDFADPEVSDLVDPNPTVTVSKEKKSLFAPGTTTVDVTAKDAAGNSSACSFDVTVVPCDSCKPKLLSPYGYGCGCSSGGDGLAVLALLAAALIRARSPGRSRRGRAMRARRSKC